MEKDYTKMDELRNTNIHMFDIPYYLQDSCVKELYGLKYCQA